METVIQLNKTAVQCLLQGKFGSAISPLQEALNGQLNLQLGLKGMETDENVSSPSPLDRVIFIELPATSHEDEQQAFSVFGRALFINKPQSLSALSAVDRDLVSFVLLYNLGLAFQLLGRFKYTGEGQARWFKRALQCYKMAGEVFQVCPSIQTNLVLFLAVTNNKGSIHSYFLESYESQHCLEWIKQVLEACPESGEEEYDVFHWNVMLLHGHEKVAPAA